jgi:hypothetical protein
MGPKYGVEGCKSRRINNELRRPVSHNPKVGGSNPPPATNSHGSGPDTWVTQRTGHMGDTFGPNGLSSGSSTRVSKSKYPKS